MGDKLCTVNGLTENPQQAPIIPFLPFLFFFPPRRRKGEINFEYIPRYQKSLDAPVRAQELPGHVRPSQNTQHQTLVPLFPKHMRLVRFWGRVREGGSFHGSQSRACPADEPRKTYSESVAKYIYCVHLEAQSTRPHPAQLSISRSSSRRAGEGHTAEKEESDGYTSPSPRWHLQLHLSPFPWKPPLAAMPISHPRRARGCPWNRHN